TSRARSGLPDRHPKAQRTAFEVVPGTGTGELTGLRGTGGFTYRHGESSVAYTFDYELD
ncbi:DUF3224 domain-containing protein, partial [Streptomyces phyllanthi]